MRGLNTGLKRIEERIVYKGRNIGVEGTGVEGHTELNAAVVRERYSKYL